MSSNNWLRIYQTKQRSMSADKDLHSSLCIFTHLQAVLVFPLLKNQDSPPYEELLKFYCVFYNKPQSLTNFNVRILCSVGKSNVIHPYFNDLCQLLKRNTAPSFRCQFSVSLFTIYMNWKRIVEKVLAS